MSKLDDKGLVPYPGVGDYPLHMENSDKGVWDYAVITQRDALLELFKEWIKEEFPSCLESDGTLSKNDFAIRFQRRIAKLKGG